MIPKIIHQIWIGNKKEPTQWTDTWRLDYIKENPHWEYHLWNEQKIDQLLDQEPELKKLYYLEPTMNGRSDIARYIILYYHGGIYIDADSVWLNHKSMDDLIKVSGDAFLGIEPGRGKFTGGVLATTKYNLKMKWLMLRLEGMLPLYTILRRRKGPAKLIGPSLVNELNKADKFCVAYEINGKMHLNDFTDSMYAKRLFRRLNCNAVFYNLKSDVIAGQKGNIDKCLAYIKDIFEGLTVFPAHYFYPISWHGISDPEMHTKIDINPESYMFQYGFTTNGFYFGNK